ncbi:hypothetical protein BH09VER1_BH09VER1_41410 [soil metagenome]
MHYLTQRRYAQGKAAKGGTQKVGDWRPRKAGPQWDLRYAQPTSAFASVLKARGNGWAWDGLEPNEKEVAT